MNTDIQYILINAIPETTWTDDIPAIASGIIALLALFTTLYQSHLSRKHNRLSVLPHLAIHTKEENGVFTITMSNDGIGPAKIETFQLFDKGLPVSEDGGTLLINAFANLDRCAVTSTESINPPFVLPAAQTIQLVELSFTEGTDPIDDYIENRLRLVVRYKSIYGEVFTFDSTS